MMDKIIAKIRKIQEKFKDFTIYYISNRYIDKDMKILEELYNNKIPVKTIISYSKEEMNNKNTIVIIRENIIIKNLKDKLKKYLSDNSNIVFAGEFSPEEEGLMGWIRENYPAAAITTCTVGTKNVSDYLRRADVILAGRNSRLNCYPRKASTAIFELYEGECYNTESKNVITADKLGNMLESLEEALDEFIKTRE